MVGAELQLKLARLLVCHTSLGFSVSLFFFYKSYACDVKQLFIFNATSTLYIAVEVSEPEGNDQGNEQI